MAVMGSVDVLVNLELAEVSPALRELIRELIREELKEELAKPATANKIAANIVQNIRLRGGKQ